MITSFLPLQSMRWLKIQERITYKIVSVTYDVLATAKPSPLSSLLTIQPVCFTRSSQLITHSRLAVTSKRSILDMSFRYYAPILSNTLPAELRFPKTVAFQGLISYPNRHFWQISRLISFASLSLTHPNLYLLLHPDPSHLTWEVPGHLTSITL